MVKHIFYKLTRKFGKDAIHCHLDSVKTDYESGLTVPETINTPIKIVLFPRKLTRGFEYDIAYLASNKNFTYGALFDVNTRQALVSRQFMPFPPGLDDTLIIEGVTYSINTPIEDLDEGYFLTITRYNKE